MRELVVVDSVQAAEWDRLAREDFHIPGRVLMESAGRACAAVTSEKFPGELARGATLLAGPGNNGGDGWVAARALAAMGVSVTAVSAASPRTDDCKANRELALGAGVQEISSMEAVGSSGIFLDALLGTGSSGPLRGRIGELAAAMSVHGAPIVAIDGPTGVDLSTGTQSGELRADLTVTFGGLRRGHLLNRGACGTVVVVDIGFPQPPGEWPRFVDDARTQAGLPAFKLEMHKGDRGRVVIVGGGAGMSGAVLHAARACFAAGAGLVKLAASADTVAAAAAGMPDVMTLQSRLSGAPEAGVLEAIEWADSVVIGPGLGVSDGASEFVSNLVARCNVPMILDADALKAKLDVLVDGGKEVVLTPHPGEFRVMLPGYSLEEEGPFAAAKHASEKLNATVLLKGVPTVIAGSAGMLVVGSGNPALATGGSGDILAGLIGAFLARGLAPPIAAAVGAQVLGRAAELATLSHPVRATRPGDVLASVPAYWRVLDEGKPPRPPVLLELPPPALV